MNKEAIEVQKGEVIDFVLSEDVSVGDVIVSGNLVGVATVSGLAGETIGVKIEGVWEIKAKDADVIVVGNTLYFDTTDRVLTTTADGNKKAGVAITGKEANTPGYVAIKLNVG